MTVTISDPTIYTEFTHTVHGAQVHHAPLIEVNQISTGRSWVRPETVTAKYWLRTQLGHTTWQALGVEVHGPWLTEDGEPDPRFTFAPKTTLVLMEDQVPEWARVFRDARFPRIRPVIDGQPYPAAPPADAAGEVAGTSLVAVTGISEHTEIRHAVYGVEVTGADPLVVPAHEPGRRDRWMRPERISVEYQWHTGSHRPTEWHVCELSVIGPWVTEDGTPDENAVGTARWPGGPRPDWVAEFVTAHTPGENIAVLATA